MTSRRLLTMRNVGILVAGVILALTAGVLALQTAAEPRTDEPAAEPLQAEKPPANRLAKETSPYLLLHAHNPVDWYPWGPEAFEKARAENKPIFLSIGYSSCFWCHVMERECFEDPEIARLMNAGFINIKVDREERPDVDQIYMTALQAFGNGGGWPLSMFLTPEGKPFFGGTYFPPETMPGRPSFPTVLNGVATAWRDDRKEVERAANELADLVRRASELTALQARVPLAKEMAIEGEQALAERFDPIHGGFGFNPTNAQRPKFPEPSNLVFLLDRHRRQPANPVARRLGFGDTAADGQAGTGTPAALDMVLSTLDQLARGGIRDHLGGGYHRYSTERTWTVPHFEKMLYDNALLAPVFLEAYEITGDQRWRREAEAIFAFVKRDLTGPEGGFLSALDAETDGEEGAYYVWTREEIDAVIGDSPDAELFVTAYGLDAAPNFEGGRYVLRRPESAGVAEGEATLEELEARLGPLRERLLEARGRRDAPLRDDKVLTAWNGLMIAAYADGFRVLEDESYRDAAEKAANFVWETLRKDDGQLLRTYRVGEAKLDAYLEDYAFLAHGLIQLHKATGEQVWLDRARSLADRMIADFADKPNGGFYFTADDHESLLARPKDPYDSALPSGNSVAIRALLDLAEATGETAYRDEAGKALDAFSFVLARAPAGVPYMLTGLMSYLDDEQGPIVEDAPAPIDPLGIGNPKGVLKALATIVEGDAPAAPGVTVRVDVQLTIDEGWHAYANPPGDPLMIATTLQLTGEAPATIASIAYPEGVPMGGAGGAFGGDGPEALIYESGTTIPVTIRLADDAAPGPLDLTLRLRYQACNDQACRPPATIDLPVRVDVKAP